MRRSRQVDMSPEAIAERLEGLRALYRLGASLARARPLGRVEDLRRADPEEGGGPPGVAPDADRCSID